MIHMSEAARQGLKDDETFVIEKRGDIEIKVIVITDVSCDNRTNVVCVMLIII